MKPKRQLVPPVNWIVAAVLTLILIVFLITLLTQVRDVPRRTIDSSNLRQIGQAALMYAMEHEGRLPENNLGPDGIPAGGQTTTVHRYALALARETGLNDISVFISASDEHPAVHHDWSNWGIIRRDPDFSSTGRTNQQDVAINPDFLESGISFQLIGGLTEVLPSTTPIGFTRGLRQDGRWDRDNAVYGSEGGHIVYLGGNVRWHRDLRSEQGQLTSTSGEPTSNILETLSPDQAVYGDPDPPIPDGARGVGTIAESPAE